MSEEEQEEYAEVCEEVLACYEGIEEDPSVCDMEVDYSILEDVEERHSDDHEGDHDDEDDHKNGGECKDAHKLPYDWINEDGRICLEENHGVTAENFEDAEKHCHQVMKALFTEAENDDVNADAEDCFAAAECLFNNIVPHGGEDEQDAGDVLAMVRSFSMFGKRRV